MRTLADYLGIKLYERNHVPGAAGITSVIDTGYPHSTVVDMLDIHGKFVDVYKITDMLMMAPFEKISERVELVRSHGIGVQPSGAFLEIARLQGTERAVLKRLREMGFTHVEVSSSTTDTATAEDDQKFAEEALASGFNIIGEVAKKWPEGDRTRHSERVINTEVTIEEMQAFLDLGAEHVYWEGHLLKKVIGESPAEMEKYYEDAKKQIHAVTDVIGHENIVFEVTSRMEMVTRALQQQWYVREFGPDVNFGNCVLTDLPFLEQIRRGTAPVFGLGTSGDHAWIRSLAVTGTGEAEPDWWTK